MIRSEIVLTLEVRRHLIEVNCKPVSIVHGVDEHLSDSLACLLLFFLAHGYGHHFSLELSHLGLVVEESGSVACLVNHQHILLICEGIVTHFFQLGQLHLRKLGS